jgi:hypothetical protein
MSRSFTTLFGHVIDEPDRSPYDPSHHFDSGLVDASWKHVRGWLGRFYKTPITDTEGIRAMCWAAHAIGDFYAHSSYAHFVQREGRGVTPYDPVTKKPVLAYDYAKDPEYSAAALSYYRKWWTPDVFDRFSRWKGRPVSGRYAFDGDSRGAIEGIIVNEPSPSSFPTPAARAFAGSLPHHDEIAVDVEEGSNKLYGPARYTEQYRWRYALAVKHVERALAGHPHFR